jgi:hypothetical protein
MQKVPVSQPALIERLKAKLKKRKQRLHKVTADQLKEVGAPWVVTDDRGIVARGTLEQLGKAEGCLHGWEYLRKD